MSEHAIFAAMPTLARFSRLGDLHGLLGSRYTADQIGSSQPVPVTGDFTSAPPLTNEYFEWIDLFESLKQAKDRYVMMELGAGYGRWGVRAGFLAKQMGIPHIEILFVEAEPQHFVWLREEIAVNGLVDNSVAIEAAISYSGKPVRFAIDLPQENLDAGSWYGQRIVDWELAPETEEIYRGKPVHREGGYGQISVDSMTLEEMTADLDRIDLIDMDIQGAEKELIENSIATLTEKVRLLHIGTHSLEIENAIRPLLREAGWVSRWDFSFFTECDTEFGKIQFEDGVQSWINPRWE